MPDLAELTKTQTGPNVIAAQRVIWNGEPGTRWTNDTGVVKYQLICRLRNTCGFCLQYHLAIGARWGIILHHGCRCKQVPIQPDAEAPHPFVDFRELLDNLPHHEQVAAIGAGNYRLLKEGLADWSDIVTPTRVRDLREVVAIKKLSLQELLDAKIKPQFAEEAHNAVHTPEHELVERHRRELMEKVKQAGLSQDQLVRQLALRMSERVTVAAGPIATGTTEEAWAASRIGTLPHAAELGLIMRHWPKPPPAGPAAPPAGPAAPPAGPPAAPTTTPTPPAPSPGPVAAAPAEPEPPAAPQTVFAKQREQAIEEEQAKPQPPHSNPNIARAQKIGADAGCRTLVVDDQLQALRIWKLQVDEAAASYHTGSDLILINARCKYWQQAEIDAAHARGWLATDHPDQIINHELGHWANRHKIGTEEFEKLLKNKSPMNPAMLARTRAEVSQYAATSRLEFVAEVHAGLKAGKTYSPKVMRDYERWGGAVPGVVVPGPKPKPAVATASDVLSMAGEAKAHPVRGEMASARREGTGKDARIVMADGSQSPPHITPAMIAPSWKEVKVSTDPKAEVLVTARDEKGRPKMVTSQSYDARSAVVKFNRTSEMLEEHHTIASEIKKAQLDPATKEEADCARLMQVQATRPGSDQDTKATVKAYGATTLEARHVIESPEGVRLKFIGKEGISHDHLIRDKDLAKMLLERKEVAESPESRLFWTTDAKVRKFIARLDGGRFTPKDFRTSAATKLASEIVAQDPTKSGTMKEHTKRVKAVAESVSRLLGNKPAEALKSYIHPMVFASWKPE